MRVTIAPRVALDVTFQSHQSALVPDHYIQTGGHYKIDFFLVLSSDCECAEEMYATELFLSLDSLSYNYCCISIIVLTSL